MNVIDPLCGPVVCSRVFPLFGLVALSLVGGKKFGVALLIIGQLADKARRYSP
ncbi:hypothetical protein D3C81_1750550 [compost metagenome]|jgi:hypothetical protein